MERQPHQKDSSIISLSWIEIDHIVSTLAEKVQSDGKPEIIIGLQRGGLIPGIILSHRLDVRCFISFNINRTIHDGINAEKTTPRLGPNISFKLVEAKDILVVDDVVGTGETLKIVKYMLNKFSPLRLRCLVCAANRKNWDLGNTEEPASLITYIGMEVHGWVVFPWEKD